ncbi:hypothetical protein RQP46_008549 [Phenoliferia psychrophenolica]
MTRSLSDAYAPWIQLLCACPNLEELSFEKFSPKVFYALEPRFSGYTSSAFGQWPMLPLVRRVRIDHTEHHNFKRLDLFDLGCLTPNLTELELYPGAFENTTVRAGATAAVVAEPHWPHLQSLAFMHRPYSRVPGRKFPLEYIRLLEAASETLVSFRIQATGSPGDSELTVPNFFTGETLFPLLTHLDHPFPLSLPHSLPQPLFPALTHLTVSFNEDAPTPAILTLFTPHLIELAIAIPFLEGWLPLLIHTCTSTPSFRSLELETIDASADLPPFSLPELRHLAQVCAEEQVVFVFATSDTRVWATDDDEMDWEEQDYVDGQPRQDSDSDDDGTSNRTRNSNSDSDGREWVDDDESDSSGSDEGEQFNSQWLKNRNAYDVSKTIYEGARPHLGNGVTREDFVAAIAPLFKAKKIKDQ